MSDRRGGKLTDPTAERTWAQPRDLSGGRRGGRAGGATGDRLEYPEDTVARDHRGVDPTPRRYDES